MIDQDEIDDWYEEWEPDVQPGECDMCQMEPGDTVGIFGIHCWCWGGEGATREDCQCPWGADF